MKKIILFFTSILFVSLSLHAQSPEKFNYQGIARNSDGDPMAAQNLGLRISILSGSSAVYMETHNVTTNDFGLYTLSVGGGTPVLGTINSVNWSSGNKHIKVEIDPNGGSNYSDIGTSELLSVPYAMYAASSGSGGGGGGGSPTGIAGGDLTGTYPNPDIADNSINTAQLSDNAVTASKLSDMGATNGQVLTFDGSTWNPESDNSGSPVWATTGNDTYYSNGLVGIGTNSPSSDLDVEGEVKIDAGNQTALKAISTSTLSDFTVEIENTAGNVLGIGNGTTVTSNPTILTGIRIQSASGRQGIFATTEDETALMGQTKDGGDAVEGWVYSGSGHSGYFHGGSGVLINDGLKTDDIEITAELKDYSSSSGTSGQVLTSTGFGVQWETPSSNSGSTWNLDGNSAGINDFIGTTNDEALRFKQNDEPAGFINGENTAFGKKPLSQGATGTSNTAIGFETLHSNTSGDNNTATGSGAMYFNVDGGNNTANGFEALLNTTGDENTAIGSNALKNSMTGSYNTATGYNALVINNSGSYNTGIGYNASVGYNNLNNATAIGAHALVYQDNSLVLGSINGLNDATADTKVGIGTASPDERLHVVGNELIEGNLTINKNANDYSKIYFKNGNNDARWTLAGHPKTDEASSLFNFYYNDGSSGSDIFQISGQGKIGINHSPTSASVFDGVLSVKNFGTTMNFDLISEDSGNKWGFFVFNKMSLYYNGSFRGEFDETSGAYSTTSDRRLKKNIHPTQSLIGKVKDIKIMDYTFKSDKAQQPQIGYIAQELEKQFPEFVNKPKKDSERQSYYTVNYAGMSAVAIKAIQEQQEIIEKQQKTNIDQQKTIEKQNDKIDNMKDQLNSLEERLSNLENDK